MEGERGKGEKERERERKREKERQREREREGEGEKREKIYGHNKTSKESVFSGSVSYGRSFMHQS